MMRSRWPSTRGARVAACSDTLARELLGVNDAKKMARRWCLLGQTRKLQTRQDVQCLKFAGMCLEQGSSRFAGALCLHVGQPLRGRGRLPGLSPVTNQYDKTKIMSCCV